MKSFSELLIQHNLSTKELINDTDKIYAHSKNNFTEYETLSAHTELTLKYFLLLLNENHLEPVVNKIIEIFIDKNSFKDKDYCSDYIKYLFIKSNFYHDFGKVNENFQNIKMKNRNFNKIKNGIESQHSVLSSFIFISSCFYEIMSAKIEDYDKFNLSYIAFLFAYIISKHHGHLEFGRDLIFEKAIINYLHKYLDEFNNTKEIDKDYLINYIECINSQISKNEFSFEVFLLLKVNSSLLTASDYYATNEYMVGLRFNDFGIMTEELRNKIYSKAYEIPYNKNLAENIGFYKGISFEEIQDFSNENINLLRQKLSSEIIVGLQNNINEKLFYIEAPTGSGKTNLSLLSLVEILKRRNDVVRIFYVFPFTTLITQTKDFLIDKLSLNNKEITEIHSKAVFSPEKGDDTENDALYDEKRKNYINNVFINYPVCLISHIKFFDILTSNKKDANYILHRLANSVVIIDEIQSYNPTQWDKINYVIQKYSELMNITFIIMSATLPKINKLFLDDQGLSTDSFIYLVQNKNKYFLNPNFKDRVKIDFTYLNEEITIERLSEIILQHSNDYFIRHNKIKAIVEFVSKLSAQKFYEYIEQKNIFLGYELYLITGTILESRRKEIINYLKSAESIGKKVLIICTQVIEAGLDIDMDIGFKDKAIIDSEEQFAGRINRNASKYDSILYIIDLKESRKVYKSDLRYKQKIDLDLYKNILLEKNYDLLYSKVFDTIKRDNDNLYLKNNLSDFISKVKSLNFKEVKEQFELIKDNTISVYVPCEISADYFSKNEIDFLSSFEPGMRKQNLIDGESVWNIYESIILNKADGINRNIDLKIVSSILSKFIFNIWKNPNTVNLLRHYTEEDIKYGFLKLLKHSYKEIYSYETGLKTDLETDCNIL